MRNKIQRYFNKIYIVISRIFVHYQAVELLRWCLPPLFDDSQLGQGFTRLIWGSACGSNAEFFSDEKARINSFNRPGLNVARLSVDGPDGDTESDSARKGVLPYFSGIMATPIDHNEPAVQLWYELKYRRFSTVPSTVEVGQDVKSVSCVCYFVGLNINSHLLLVVRYRWD